MSIKKLFEDQKQHLNYFFSHISLEDAERLLETLYRCQGLLFFTGVGKSGLVAKKIAVTLTSTGTRALYLSPTNALHGDIGMVKEEDTFIFLSKSGESDELMNLIPYLRNKGAKLIAITSKKECRLLTLCDDFIVLPLEKELGPLNLTPTTSTTIQMIFGDVLTVALMEKKKFHLEQYQMNHPAGKIGKQLLLKVQDLMLTDERIPLCHPEDRLVDVLVDLSNKRCGCLLITSKENQLKGIFTDGDLRRALQKHGPQALELTMENLMTTQPRSISPDVLAVDAMSEMESDQKRPITVLPVVHSKDKKVVGIIKMHDILQSGL